MAGILVYKNEGGYLIYTSENDRLFDAVSGLMNNCLPIIKIKKEIPIPETKKTYNFIKSHLDKINSQPICIDKSQLIKDLF